MLLMTVLKTAVFERAGDFVLIFDPWGGLWLGLQVKIYLKHIGALENGHINQVVFFLPSGLIIQGPQYLLFTL